MNTLLPSSKNISRKLVGKGGTEIDNLKIQHADEIATLTKDHETRMRELQDELEILRESVDEHTDTLMPLPSPTKTLKFNREDAPPLTSGKRVRKIEERRDVMKMISNLKQKHNEDLTKAAEIYAKRLTALKREVEKYKTQAETLKMSAIQRDLWSEESCITDDSGIDKQSGIAKHEKENVVSRKSKLSIATPTIDTTNRRLFQQQTALTATADVDLQEEYDRLFEDDYQFQIDPECEKALAKETNCTKQTEDIDKLCKELMTFMEDVRSKSLRSQITKE